MKAAPGCLLNKNKNREGTIPGDPLQAPWDAGLCWMWDQEHRLPLGRAKGASAARQEQTGAAGLCLKASQGNTPQLPAAVNP